MLGYPGITTFRCWLRQRFGSTGKFRINHIQYTQEQKQEAVIKFLIRETKPVEIAKEYGIDRSCLYACAKELLGKEYSEMPKKDLKQPLPDDITELQAQVTALKRQIYELQLEKDILEKAAEIIKKDPGVDLKKLKNKEKRELIDALKDKYPLPILFQRLHIAKSSYYYQRKTFALPDKYQALKETITVLFNENRKCYGYINIEDKYIPIIDSAEFQRLRNIRQTGYASLYPSALHNRFVHSLGVFHFPAILPGAAALWWTFCFLLAIRFWRIT